MTDVDPQFIKYKNDPRIACRYGAKCYQKSSVHLEKYKHPPKKRTTPMQIDQGPSKKLKVDDALTANAPKTDIDVEAPVTKREYISDSEDDTEIEEVPSPKQSQELPEETEITETTERGMIDQSNPRQFIKDKFLVDMPEDFYQFWEFCKELKPSNPSEALSEVDLKLVGPFDVLSEKFHSRVSSEDYLRHWRYYYDPPEFQTVLKGDDKTGFHIGYFRDSPDEPPAFLAANWALKDGTFSKLGDNIFCAVYSYLEDMKRTGNPFKKMQVGKMQSLVKSRADQLSLNLSKNTEQIRKRELKVVTKTANKIGLVVHYNKKTQLGYRDLALSDKEILGILNKLKNAFDAQKAHFLSELQPVLTYASIALDECDFGTGVKLGWDILAHGVDSLNSTIARFLSSSYKLLNKNAFAEIAEAHMAQRKTGTNLNVV